MSRLQRADERLGDPPPKVDPGAFSGQRQGWKTHKRTLWLFNDSVCVAGVQCWEISLGLADPWNVTCLSYRIILGFSCMYSLCIVSFRSKVIRGSQISPRHCPPSRGGDGQKLELEMVTTFTYKPSLVRIDTRHRSDSSFKNPTHLRLFQLTFPLKSEK